MRTILIALFTIACILFFVSLVAVLWPLPDLWLPTRGRAFIVCIAASVLMTILGKTSTIKSILEDEAENEIMAVNAKVLCQEYNANEVLANSRYENKKLRVTGLVEQVNQPFSSVMTVGLKGDENNFSSVSCEFKGKHKKTLASLVKNQTVSIEGICYGPIGVWMKEKSVKIEKCMIVEDSQTT